MDWREDFSSNRPIFLFLHISSRLEDEKQMRLVCSGGILGSREPTMFHTRGEFAVNTQVIGPKMKRWAVMVGTLLFLTVFFVPITQAADEFAYSSVLHSLKVETMEVGDVPGHIVGVFQSGGLGFFTKGPISGQTATRTGTGYFDYVNGKGTFRNYLVYTFQDGSTLSVIATGTNTPVDGGKRATYKGETEWIGGTGKFEGMKGKGTFKGERFGSPKTGGDGTVDVTGTYWK